MITNIMRPIWGNCSFPNPFNLAFNKKATSLEIVASKFKDAFNTINDDKHAAEAKIIKHITYLPIDSVVDGFHLMQINQKAIFLLGIFGLVVSSISPILIPLAFGKEALPYYYNSKADKVVLVMFAFGGIFSSVFISLGTDKIYQSLQNRLNKIPIFFNDVDKLNNYETKLKNAQCDFLFMTKIDGLNADIISYLGQQIFDIAVAESS